MSGLNGETGGIDRIDCGELADMAAELALGVLTGRERASALAHLDGCPACSEYVRELTATGEELLGLLPPHEPPAGFESRVLNRLGLPMPSGETQRRGLRRPTARTLTAAAIVAAVVAGGLGGWGLHSAATSSQTAAGQVAGDALSTATLLTAGHETAGEIFLHNAAPQWMYAHVELDSAKTTTVLCQLVTADGRITTVGSFKLTDGYGSWGGGWRTAAKVTGARLVTPDGTVLASATF